MNKYERIALVFTIIIVSAILIISSFMRKDLAKMNPEQVVELFLNAAEKGDLETIKQVHDPEVWKIISPIWEEGSIKFAYSKMKVCNTKIKGSHASVYISMKDGSEEDYITLSKKVDGWKITYDKPLN